jgi:hypothetical protein
VRRREEAERPVDTVVVVVDGLRQVDDADRPQTRDHVLQLLQVVRGLERVIAADRDERVDLVCLERRVDVAQLLISVLVGEIVDLPHRLAGVRA